MKIALVAHDAKKSDALALAQNFRRELALEEIYSTEGTGKRITQVTGIQVTVFKGGPEGGDVEIANKILKDDLDILIFLVDGMSAHAHEYDIQTLIRTATNRNTVVAINYATAAIVLDSLRRHSEATGKF